MMLLILIGGLHAEAVTPGDCPTLAAVLPHSAHTLRARSLAPGDALACNAALFYSRPGKAGPPAATPAPGPSLVAAAHAAGRRCGLFYNWEPIGALIEPGCLVQSVFRDNRSQRGGDAAVAAEAAVALASSRLDLACVYLGSLEVAGNTAGWLSPGYLAQAQFVDAVVERLLMEVPGDAHVLLQAEHAGSGTEAVPWMLNGPGIRSGHALEQPISLLDTAPTLARLLNFEPPRQWEGQAVDEAFA